MISENPTNESNEAQSNTHSTSQRKSVEAVEPLKVSARALYAAYAANEIEADNEYKNKTLEVSGTIENIGKDVLDNPYISLKTDDLIVSVQCMLAASEVNKASHLKKGAFITLEGRNTGKFGNVLIKDCKIANIKNKRVS